MKAELSPGAVTQFAVLDVLLKGVYAEGISVADVLAAGDTGVGCCEGLGGEVVVLDGVAYECTVDAPPRPMDDAEKLRFVDVCALGRSREIPLDDLALSQ